MINSGHVEYSESTKWIIKYNRESYVATGVTAISRYFIKS